MTTKALTLRQRRFIDAFVGSAHGNGTEAARIAGYNQTKNALGVTACRLLRKASVASVIQARATRATQASILTAEERDTRLSEIALAHDDAIAVAAIRELNKCSGRHSIKHVVDGKLTLEQIIMESRK